MSLGPAGKALVGLALGAAALALWWVAMDGRRALATAATCAAGPLVLGFACLLVTHALRLVRWFGLLRLLGRVPFGRVFRLLAAGDFVNTYLPVRVGEVGRIVALTLHDGYSAGAATASVVVDRFYGVAVRLAVLPLLLTVPGTLPRGVAVSAWLFAAVAVLGLVAVVGWARGGERVRGLLRRGLVVLPPRLRPRSEAALVSFADAAVSANLRPAAAGALLAVSAAGLLAQASSFVLFFRAVGADLPVALALVGTALLDLLAVAPSPPAGIGTSEWYPTLLFAIGFGLPRTAAAAAALLSHAAWIVIVTAAGATAVGVLREMVPRRREGGPVS